MSSLRIPDYKSGSNKTLAFPAPVSCPSCGRACCEDELGGCFTCGDQFCDQCDSICSCDRLAAVMENHATAEMMILRAAMRGIVTRRGWLKRVLCFLGGKSSL
jgi:hypothetical protein